MSTKRHFKQRRQNALFHVTDWFPTLLNLAGVSGTTTNERFALDGRDFSSFFAPKEEEVATDVVVEERTRFIIGVRHYFQRSTKGNVKKKSVRST